MCVLRWPLALHLPGICVLTSLALHEAHVSFTSGRPSIPRVALYLAIRVGALRILRLYPESYALLRDLRTMGNAERGATHRRLSPHEPGQAGSL
jgi:hypothetical protein